MSDEPKFNNPVARLVPFAEYLQNKATGQTGLVLCSYLFNVADPDVMLQQRAKVRLLEMLFAAKADTEKLDNSWTSSIPLLAPYEYLTGQVSGFNIGAAWEGYKPHWTDHRLDLMRMASNLLSEKFPEPSISAAQIAELQSSVDILIEQISSSTLPAELKTALLTRLNDIRNALWEYRFRGSDGIKFAVDALVGRIVMSSHNNRSEDEQKIAWSIYAFAKKAYGYVEVASLFHSLYEQAQPLIGLITPLLN